MADAQPDEKNKKRCTSKIQLSPHFAPLCDHVV